MMRISDATAVYDSYWRFAAERLAMYYRRLLNPSGPWTTDPVLAAHRFTNTFRAADRVSQYLIREVQYRPDRSQAPAEVFFRTMLFKIFNRIETWELIETAVGPVSWQSADLDAIVQALDIAMAGGSRIYSAAYIMPSPQFGHVRKHANHIALIDNMMRDGLPGQLANARSLEAAYGLIAGYRGLGPFLAFQYTIDLNYSSLLDFDEDDFVVAGPGALDGIAKCFGGALALSPQEIIRAVTERQDSEFARLGLDFPGLFGRRLKQIDCQNLFCEISKYARVAHPDALGASGRTRIKQKYSDSGSKSVEAPFFPPKWGLEIKPPPLKPLIIQRRAEQLSLFQTPIAG